MRWTSWPRAAQRRPRKGAAGHRSRAWTRCSPMSGREQKAELHWIPNWIRLSRNAGVGRADDGARRARRAEDIDERPACDRAASRLVSRPRRCGSGSPGCTRVPAGQRPHQGVRGRRAENWPSRAAMSRVWRTPISASLLGPMRRWCAATWRRGPKLLHEALAGAESHSVTTGLRAASCFGLGRGTRQARPAARGRRRRRRKLVCPTTIRLHAHRPRSRERLGAGGGRLALRGRNGGAGRGQDAHHREQPTHELACVQAARMGRHVGDVAGPRARQRVGPAIANAVARHAESLRGR